MRRMHNYLVGIVGATALTMGAQSAGAALTASGDLTPFGSGPSYQYNITLHNTGDVAINTFWYAWVPGEDFLKTSPANIHSPTGWIPFITGGSPGDGYAIEWINNTTPLAGGGTLSGFQFTSTDTPAQILGNSFYYPTTPVNTSFVFGTTGAETQFLVAIVPEPAALGLLLATASLVGLRRHGSRSTF